MRGVILLLVAGLLAGCASLPPPPLPARQDLRDFALEGRFALRATPPDQPAQSAGGRLAWTHKNQIDTILLANPLGYGVAEIESGPAIARLRLADGKTSESSDPDSLIEEVTGQRLPVARLPAWLLGRSGGRAQIAHDDLGRPLRLVEDGWQIDYAYDNAAPDALPGRLTLSNGDGLELRLRIEQWKNAP